MPTGRNVRLSIPKWALGGKLMVNGRWYMVTWINADGSSVGLEECKAPPVPLLAQEWGDELEMSEAQHNMARYADTATKKGQERDVAGLYCWTRNKGITIDVPNYSNHHRLDVINCYDDGTPIREQGRGAARRIPGWVWSAEDYRYLPIDDRATGT